MAQGAAQLSKAKERTDQILIKWMNPKQPNGVITTFALYRGPAQIYRGIDMQFLDISGIEPYQTYIYTLKACNRVGCADSSASKISTLSAAPGEFDDPEITDIKSFSFKVKWKAMGTFFAAGKFRIISTTQNIKNLFALHNKTTYGH